MLHSCCYVGGCGGGIRFEASRLHSITRNAVRRGASSKARADCVRCCRFWWFQGRGSGSTHDLRLTQGLCADSAWPRARCRVAAA